MFKELWNKEAPEVLVENEEIKSDAFATN